MKIYTPLKAIRRKCLDCSNGSQYEVRLCPCTDCTLWPYRLGHRPKCAPTSTVEELIDADGNFIEEMHRSEELAATEGSVALKEAVQ